MRRRFLVSTAIADLIALAVAVLVASLSVFGTAPWAVDLPGSSSLWPLIGFFVIGGLLGTVLSTQSWQGSAPRPTYGRAVTIVAVGAITASLLLLATGAYRSRIFFTIVPVVWLLGAFAHRAVRRRRPWTESMVIISTEKGLIDHIRSAPHANVVAVLDPTDEHPNGPPETGVTVVVDLRAVLSEGMAQYVSSCAVGGVNVRALTSVYEEHTGRLPLVHLSEGWELTAPVSRTNPYQIVKSVLEPAVVALLTPLWVPLAGVCALLVRLDSAGPVIFSQERVGRRGEIFTLYKFRTMVAGADADGPKMTYHDDQRITRAGRFLRRFRADEIPQLFNVLKGDLNLVGPRPEQVPMVAQFATQIPFYEQRHLIRPGVTGWAQVHYGYADDEADTIEKLAFDLYYVKNVSPWIDIHVLGMSIWTVLSGFGHQ